MKNTFKTVDALMEKLQSLQPLPVENKKKLEKKFRLEFSFNSNHIEGNTLTFGETELLLIFGKTTGNHELREYEEMTAHDVAFDLIKEWAGNKEKPLTESDIKNLHHILLVRPFWKEAQTQDGQHTRRLIKVGNYKDQPNNVRLQNGEIFEFASVNDTPILMGELLDWYRQEEHSLHPVTLAAMLHYKFVRIHPFDDGNGRLSRLLMNYVLLQNGFPPVVIKATEKKQYLFALNQADTGDFTSFINFIEEQLIWSLDISLKAARGENIDELEDFDKKMILLKRQLGEKPGTKIEITYGREAVDRLVSQVLIPLAQAWEQKLKSFETLFLSRNVTIIFTQSEIQDSAFDTDIFDSCIKYFSQRDPATIRKSPILLRASFTGLRNFNNGINMNGGEISISLFHTSYEIKWLTEKPVNKLYPEALTDDEMDKVASDLGNWFHKNVEEQIEKSKEKKGV